MADWARSANERRPFEGGRTEARSSLETLASLIRARNGADIEIARLIGCPVLIGHTGEFIASTIFGIELSGSATERAIDGRFQTGRLTGRSVNVKWYARLEGCLDVTPLHLPDFYLVMAGPRGPAATSRGAVRPWLIESVYLFEADRLIAALKARGVKVGVATSVAQQLWSSAEIYPRSNSSLLALSEEQRRQVALFSKPTA